MGSKTSVHLKSIGYEGMKVEWAELEIKRQGREVITTHWIPWTALLTERIGEKEAEAMHRRGYDMMWSVYDAANVVGLRRRLLAGMSEHFRSMP